MDWELANFAPLFSVGRFLLHSGEEADWKIDCDGFRNADWGCLALLIDRAVRNLGLGFAEVEGVPRGGLRLAQALQRFRSTGPLLIVDDVLTTGTSMEFQRQGREDVIGFVVFDRSCGFRPDWVYVLFELQFDV